MTSAAALTWFARHEIRLAWREWLAMMTAGRRWRKRSAMIWLIVFVAIMHLPAYAVIGRFADLEGAAGQIDADRHHLLRFSGWALMLSQAIESVTRVFYARADLDLIMSSPALLANVFSVRIAAIALSVIAMALLLSMPFINVLVIGGGVQMVRGLWRGDCDRPVGGGGCDRGHRRAVSQHRAEPDPAGRANRRGDDRRRLCHRAADRGDLVLRHAVALRGADLGCRGGVRARPGQSRLVAGARDARRRRGAAVAACRRPASARRRNDDLFAAVCRLYHARLGQRPRPLIAATAQDRSARVHGSKRCGARSSCCCAAIPGWCRRR